MMRPLTFTQKIGLAFVAGMMFFSLGFIQGRNHGREATLKAAVAAYQTREKINEDVQSLDPVALCRALGGMPDECAALMRRMDETTAN